ncbi:malonate decarboxylase holo-ACP synthase [Lactobacillus sp. CBA3605]|uniref:malonate decarboxylase holo-ACP synthase n=1 Tax=Lactobacillus sp. CBA3605 TaxID=2099788 RepID=UPI000CFDFD3D|nr:malonate decarboxylase holo-ACP synthase [Lactobacillus sp. CBA3605]AVK62098.1 malonate decarboxylase holo-ACP synthase [Lactobacillus sp. CBA3605]
MASLVPIAPHTIIRLVAPTDFEGSVPIPSWVPAALQQMPVVVVRRGPQLNGIPVGVRGPQRNQRWAGWLKGPINMAQQISPEQLVTTKAWQMITPNRQQLPVFQALPAIASIMSLPWGLGGSAGFELATGQAAVKPTSDLDLIMPAQHPLTVSAAQQLLQALNQFGVHVDVQLVAGQNGFSLEEYAQQRTTTVLLKTAQGPQLVTNPWQAVKN